MSANSQLTVAVHALCWLEYARRTGRPALTSAEIADSLASHPVLVRRTLAPLRDHGLLEVTGRGPGAGWRLARPAAAVTLADLHAALAEPVPFDLHPHEPKQTCPVGYGIRPVLSEAYADVQSAISATLATRSVADILDATLTEHPLPAS
ncbi:MAG TPA: Rrf2 family transcriptional regulator [Flexivirga sp.]|uniref:Rrf2 family transcriptional regulator n=1 Tax=Flexivirga sp. TaxID=1962927 RepID=UPI002C00EA3A|nr:Rrf2 family transcriptional regulator [Flexivirga sp.]HWC24932.1 Rrf2 family transcriptional regulator [Flexivirga sp.]